MPEWKNTVNLPRTDFPMKANLQTAEPEAIARWESMDLYGQIRALRRGAPKFVFHDGPPYANARIHLGTALNKILKDIVIKSRSMEGFDVPYLPGYDCHGLPIELKVDRELGPKKREMSVAEIRRACREYAGRFIDVMTAEFKRLMVFGDWDHYYLTMNPQYQADIARALGKFVERGLVYKGKKPVHWCIHCRTALAEAEVEYEDHSSPSIYVEFPLDPASAADLGARIPALAGRTVSVLIWTTTPWTIPSNLAIAFHPDFDYGAYDVDGRIVIVAEALASRVAAEIGRSFDRKVAVANGKLLEGLKFRHPLYDRGVSRRTGRLRDARAGNRRGAYGPGTRRRRLSDGRQVRPGHLRAGRRVRPLPRIGRVVRRQARLRCQPARRGGPRDTRTALASDHRGPPVPALLAMPQPGDFSGHFSVVRPAGRRACDYRGGWADTYAARGGAACDRPRSEMDSRLGPRPDFQHGVRPPRLVHFPAARVGRADPGPRLHVMRPRVVDDGAHRPRGDGLRAIQRGCVVRAAAGRVRAEGPEVPVLRRHCLRTGARHSRRLVRFRLEPRGRAGPHSGAWLAGGHVPRRQRSASRMVPELAPGRTGHSWAAAVQGGPDAWLPHRPRRPQDVEVARQCRHAAGRHQGERRRDHQAVGGDDRVHRGAAGQQGDPDARRRPVPEAAQHVPDPRGEPLRLRPGGRHGARRRSSTRSIGMRSRATRRRPTA